MNHHDDLERLISGSLASRSDGLGRADQSLDDVHRRVESRRSRRRQGAAFGAVATLVVGAFALTAIGSSDPTTVPLAAPVADAGTPSTVPAAWRCIGQLPIADADGASYFEHCEPATTEGGITATTEVPPPTTTIVCPADELDADAAAVSTVPCAWGPPSTLGAGCQTVDQPADVTVPCQTVTTITIDMNERAGGEQAYVVVAGDSLASIAALHDIALDTLIIYNKFADGVDHLIVPGEYVLIPPGALVSPGGPPTPIATSTTSTSTTTTTTTSP